jgi:peptidyl-prolyl cis-trans isomerase C
MNDRLARLAREPLVHFLIAGALIFALFGGATNDPADRTIMVSEAQIQGLASQWEATWQRQPSPAEVDGLIRDWVKDEVYTREAIRLGLDKDDIIVRRRMRSKMEFLVAAQSESEAPSDAALQSWLGAHKGKYATDPMLSFDSVFVGDGDAAVVLARLKQGARPESLGTTLSVPTVLDAAQATEIDRQFGEGFAKRLAAQPLGIWAGPVESGFGPHIVRVRKVSAGSVPPLAQIRQAVENDWREANRLSREAKAYQALLDGYTVRIAKP